MDRVVEWPQGLEQGFFVKRYKRFFVDFEYQGGLHTAHVPNTGSLMGLLREGAPVLVLPKKVETAKLKWSLKAIQASNGTWVGVDTGIPSRVLAWVLAHQPERLDPDIVEHKLEVQVAPGTRLDAWYKTSRGLEGFIELKNVTLARTDTTRRLVAEFPDAVTERGLKHIQELVKLAQADGRRSHLIFVVQREDTSYFRPAWDIDPKYSQALFESVEKGLSIDVWSCRVDSLGVYLSSRSLSPHLRPE
ncbi:MAG: DNA/RNA nuclease SfsA [Bdellovibrionaceae bacterium]|nr:DNA/RNA nuclease SfsA [Pseudobdellovibrionaceae bacterium]